MRSEGEVNHAVEEYADMIKRVCFYYLKNHADTEDIFQKVFLKYMMHEEIFSDGEHEKAWMLRVTINACKDYLKSFFRRSTVPLEMIMEMEAEVPEDHREVLEAVLSLPDKYKDPIYLHYYEGYSAAEIGKILGKKENTVYSLLSRARGILKEKLGGEGIGE
ncbi:MAG: RNA polymerase sigma factor [Eubacterium sp.]|nr:RNA polymerase sigma factor [Eubacterium sp.]MCI8918466.1 RNA polymerase sigma factor [Eubacterium sp.]